MLPNDPSDPRDLGSFADDAGAIVSWHRPDSPDLLGGRHEVWQVASRRTLPDRISALAAAHGWARPAPPVIWSYPPGRGSATGVAPQFRVRPVFRPISLRQRPTPRGTSPRRYSHPAQPSTSPRWS